MSEITLPPIKIDCPECVGRGAYDTIYEGEFTAFECPKCDGTGEVWNYEGYEVNNYIAWMREHGRPDYELRDDAIVRILAYEKDGKTVHGWFEWDYSRYKKYNHGEPCIVAHSEMPKPPADWRVS